VLSSFASLDGGESFEASALGSADEVIQERFGDNECILITGTKAHPAASVVLRGANAMMLDEMERSLHDALCVVKRTLESGRVVPGGGACEASVAVFLDSFAMSISSREQAAIVAFSEALLSLPKTLAANCGSGDPMDLVAQLRAAHHAALTSSSPATSKTDDKNNTTPPLYAIKSGNVILKNVGLDLETGTLRDSLAAGVMEPMLSKIRMLKSATEAAISILRIDDMMTITPPPSKDEHQDQCH